ncbi:NAD(P)/FAD-dependent oxidoreductase [Candidatus Woesearchaeota archaeon]|nr:MAG: NAD(P)/FAD-dependent oxidoreductase [Candidatus Woesearchaeota archaeon]
MTAPHDIIVIGAGSGGLNIAGFMNRAGFNVLLIDKNDTAIGGDCLNFGCVPSKALIHVARLARDAQAAERFGITAQGRIDFRKVRAYITEKQNRIRQHENAAWFRAQGMDVVLGTAQFSGRQRVTVDGKEFQAKRIILATGSRPRPLTVPGIEQVRVETNETIFGLEELPRRLLVVGGGPIGIELGQAFRHLGSEVTIIVRGKKFLPKESAEIAGVLRTQLEKEGVRCLFESEVEAFTGKHQAVVVSRGSRETVTFDVVLASIGRVLNTEGLALERAGIAVDSRGKIVVDSYLRTTNKNVFVCGDIAGAYQFTHAAELHASIIIGNFFRPRPLWKKVSYDTLSWVTFTSPEIATWGLSEEQLRKRGTPYERLVFDFDEDDRAIIDEAQGKLVLYIAKDRVLGGSMVGEHAGELAQELILATSAGIPLKALFEKVYPYPTASRVNKRAISLQYAKKLTPFTKRILHWLY